VADKNGFSGLGDKISLSVKTKNDQVPITEPIT
jgi:hypothetical protein